MRRYLFQLLYGLGVQNFLRQKKRKERAVTALCFHRVANEPDFFWPPLPVKDFDFLMQYTAQNYQVVPLSLISEPPKGDKPLAVITFDDGYRDFLTNALPVLQKYNLPSTHHIVSDCADTGELIWTHRLNDILFALKEKSEIREILTGAETVKIGGYATDAEWQSAQIRLLQTLLKLPKNEREKVLAELSKGLAMSKSPNLMMNWDEIRRCQAAGVEIGSHSRTHDALWTITNPAQLDDELAFSKQRIEAETQRPVTAIAYPNGRFNDAVIQASIKAGYQNLLLTDELLYFPETEAAASIKKIPRITVLTEPVAEACLRFENFHTLINQMRG